ncbi:DUF4349 domain-containing protein [Sporosarcina sp. ACRSM]|uniref:DUF4349 domain-containing protein n=1 Tax=Sporosarcina sp. ACRSM TaxID=2918216 RepID=UPI001EF5A0C4|nr:DUF4349 domain-containing protein [Sporosarcina sp. ACRSM]MCG7333754.1 DUF4349 domain-containing protein [Sporosarcina sp. ACRSM]
MKGKIVFILFLCFVLVACSSNHSENLVIEESKAVSNDIAVESATDHSTVDTAQEVQPKESTTDRMIIHQAQLQVKVKELENAMHQLKKKAADYGGYIVESNVYRESADTVSGKMIIRIPENHFQAILTDTEEQSAEVLVRNVTGQDVTEQYVDLQSRVKSKRAVEERLLAFMGDAEKTEDLLKISSDLATVQEEIEVIVGKMNYLENQTAYSTIEITMFEDRVVVPTVDSKNLDTWGKTKKQLATSTNFILAAGSGLIVFLIGNLPVIVLLLLVGTGVYFIIKRKKPNG